MKKIGWLMLFWLCNVSAQIPEAVKQQVDLRIKHQHNPSIALGVFVEGQAAFYVSGWQNQEQQVPATTQTVYEIGSITKTFTGLLLAILNQESQINLDDPVNQYWEKPFRLVDAQGLAITLKQLSTHTSGLPRLPDNLPLFSNDPYAEYDRDDLLKALVDIKPGEAGKNYAYSNLAVGLLGETLSNIGRKNYNDLMTQKIIKPLSLESTYMLLVDVPTKHLATGYTGNKPSPAWNFKALAAAGSIRSSIKDLLAYGVAYIEQPKTLKNALSLASQTHYQQDKLQVGLGWHINEGILWHNGGTGGFRSMLMIDPKQKKAVAAITNHNQHDVEDIAAHLMNPERPMKKHDFPVEIDPAKLVEFSGEYQQSDNDSPITIKVINNRLFFTAAKQPKQAMFYIGNDTFKFKMADVKINFVRDAQGNIQSLNLMGWGEPQSHQKV